MNAGNCSMIARFGLPLAVKGRRRRSSERAGEGGDRSCRGNGNGGRTSRVAKRERQQLVCVMTRLGVPGRILQVRFFFDVFRKNKFQAQIFNDKFITVSSKFIGSSLER